MPLKLVPPKPGRTPYWRIRGTYLGRSIQRSAKTDRSSVARALLKRLEREIERGALAEPGDPTFAHAALSYMRAGGERRFLRPIIEYFGNRPLREIDQGAIDQAAEVLYPFRSAATRNRQLYSPVSAILRRSGMHIPLRRPKGHMGNSATGWLWPEQAEALFAAAGRIDREFRLLLIMLCYTGMRLSEALSLDLEEIRIDEQFAYLAETKNGSPRPVFLPSIMCKALRDHPRGLERPGERLFRWQRKGSALYELLRRTTEAAKVSLPRRQAFHIFCHTYATWMRRYAGADSRALLATGRWKNVKSVDRYSHVVIAEEARRAELLPTTPPPQLRAVDNEGA